MKLSKWTGATLLAALLATGAACRREGEREREGAGKEPGAAPTTPAEREPVAGREVKEAEPDRMPAPAEAPSAAKPVNPMMTLVDETGKEWQITDPALVAEVEQKLTAAGFDPAKLAESFQTLQEKHGLATTGKLDRETAKALGVDWDKLIAARKAP